MKTRILKCEMCGNEFKTTAPNVKYCSALCKYAAEKKHRLKFIAAHPNYNRDYKRMKKDKVAETSRSSDNRKK